jgi:hypothetical protein
MSVLGSPTLGSHQGNDGAHPSEDDRTPEEHTADINPSKPDAESLDRQDAGEYGECHTDQGGLLLTILLGTHGLSMSGPAEVNGSSAIRVRTAACAAHASRSARGADGRASLSRTEQEQVAAGSTVLDLFDGPRAPCVDQPEGVPLVVGDER